MRCDPSMDLLNLPCEIQVYLFDLTAACDFAEEGGESYQVESRRNLALGRIRAAFKGLCMEAQRVLCALGDAEGGPRDAMLPIRARALALWELSRPEGGLDLLVDHLEDLRGFTGEPGALAVQSARASLMEVRMHLHEVQRNYTRMVGAPLIG